MSNKKILLNLLLIPILLFSSISPLSAPGAMAFDDVDPDDQYYVAIRYLQENGIIEGYEDNTFRASQPVNKAEALKMITKALNLIEEAPEAPAEKPFPDVGINAWYAPYTAKAQEIGVISGNPEGYFEPDKNINLAESLKITLKSYMPDYDYQILSEYLYDDTPEDSWFTPYTSFAGKKGMINVYPSNTVNPSQEMTRGYLAENIYRLLLANQGFEFGKATFYGKAVQGNNTASGEVFDYNLMTAAHKTLPFGTIVRVTNLANGKQIDVKINDRGPYGPGRVIDLSRSAFEQIAWLGTGVIYVQFEVIETPE